MNEITVFERLERSDLFCRNQSEIVFFEYTISHTGHAYSTVQYVRQKATAEGKVEKSRSPEIGEIEEGEKSLALSLSRPLFRRILSTVA